jgi:hypothetical protein
MRTWIIRIIVLDLIVTAIWFGVPFLKSPETQALEQHQRFIAFGGNRNWGRVLTLMSVDYRDAWGMKREEAVSLAHELLQGYIALDFQWQPQGVKVQGKTATVTGFIKASGTGGGFSAEIISRINALHEPFVFTWRKDGWKPGDWKLTGISQPELAATGLEH